MTTENNIIEQGIESTDEAWKRLYELANSCINWGESDIDKELFISLGKQTFEIKIVE